MKEYRELSSVAAISMSPWNLLKVASKQTIYLPMFHYFTKQFLFKSIAFILCPIAK